MKWDGLPQLKQRKLLFPLLEGGKLGRGPCCCCCWSCGVGGQLNWACWGGLATHLPGKLFRGGARVAVVWTNRYLGGCAVEGPVGVFSFFSARWAEMQSSWVMAILTNSLKVLAFTKFSRSLSLVFRPRQITFAGISVRMITRISGTSG
jgi:hypothetical protein